MVVIHGGPDFDHSYLLPEFDRLADIFHLVFYDQRGRSRPADQVRPAEVTIRSEIEDLDTIRQHFRFGAAALLGEAVIERYRIHFKRALARPTTRN